MSDPLPRISLAGPARDETSHRPSNLFPDEWKAGDQQLREQLHRLRGQIDQHLQDLLEAVEQDLIDPLQSTAHEAAAIHTALVKTSHFDDAVEEVPPRLRWVRVRDYRRDTMERVIAPLRNQLAELDLGSALREQWHAFWSELDAIPPRMPSSVTRPEPATLYAPSSEDPIIVTLRKRLIRARRRFQRLASSTAQDAVYAQEVPLRALVAYHLRVRLPDRLAAHERAICQHLARAIAAFERAVTTWTHRLLDAERHLDHAAHHVSEDANFSLADAASLRESPSPFAVSPSPLAPSEIWATVNAEAKALDQQLRGLSALGFGDRPVQIKSAAHDAWSALSTDVEQAGSFLLARKDRTIPGTASPAQHSSEIADRWSAWYRQATDRLAFCETLAALHDTIYTRHDALLRALDETSLEPLTAAHANAARALRAVHEEAASLLHDDSPSTPRAPSLRDLFDRFVQTVDAKLLEPLQTMHTPRRLRTTLDNHLSQFERFIDEEPASFQLHGLAPPSAELIAPDIDAREVNVQSIAQDHFDAFFANALRDTVQTFCQQVQAILHEDGRISDGLRSTLASALKRLDAASPDDAEATNAAHERALDALTRSVDAINAQAERARTAFPSLAAAIYQTFTTAWMDLHDRARAESRLREHLIEYRTITGRGAQDAAHSPPRLHTSHDRSQQNAHRKRRHAEGREQRNRSAVGLDAFRETASLETLESIASTERIPSSLPLAYRRLFAFRPVTDPALLTGRQNDLDRLGRHVDRWRRGRANPLIVTGPPGCGRTSFLRVAQKRFLRNADVHWIALDDRLQRASTFAEHVVHALNLPLSPHDEKELTLDRVREHLQAQPRPDVPRVCIVEPLEHLFLRTVDGTAVADRVLAFMSRTATHVLWLATVSDSGWQVLNRTASMASTLVLPHRLAPLDRSSLETLILTRHQRSGLRMAFDPPEEANPPLRRRLRNAPSEERKQAILQKAYFDRLHAHCGSNVMLALFYWLRSARLDNEALTIHVRPMQPIRFDVLERFSMQQTFALKALIDHATLTVEAYSEVAAVSVDASLALFKSLANALLIQPADARAMDTSPASIEPGRPYRIRPLVLHPVLTHLRARNLLF